METHSFLENDLQPFHDFVRIYMIVESITTGRKEDKWISVTLVV